MLNFKNSFASQFHVSGLSFIVLRLWKFVEEKTFHVSKKCFFGVMQCRQIGNAALTVWRKVDFVRQFGDVNIKSILNVIQYLSVSSAKYVGGRKKLSLAKWMWLLWAQSFDILVRHECNGQSFGTKTSGTCDTMQICVGIFWHIVVEYNVHAFNIHAAAE